MKTSITKEQLAHMLYDSYCEAAGGLAYNGDPLPKSEEFFKDESKSKQADAWRAVAKVASEMILLDLKMTKEEDLEKLKRVVAQIIASIPHELGRDAQANLIEQLDLNPT